MEPGPTEEHGESGDAPAENWSAPLPSHDSTQVLPAVPAEPAPSFTERSGAATGQLPQPPLDATQQTPVQRFTEPAENSQQEAYPGYPPSQQQPAYGQPPYGQPPYGQPSYGRPSYGRPSYGQPSYGQPSYGQPAYGQPTSQSPGYEQPGYQQPGYQQPGYQQPGYQQPGYQQPAYGGPAYGQTAYQPPAYDQAAYSQPSPEYTPATGYGSPPPTSAKRKPRKGLWALLIVVIILAAAVGVLFAVKPSPLFKKVLDSTAVEETIENQSKNGLGDYSNVSCPSNEKVKAGTTFECTASGNKRISVTIKNSKGDYEWKSAN